MLFRKQLRTMKQYRAQFISMIIMIALGIGVFVGFNIEWYSLDRNTAAFFADTHFADYRILSEQGFSREELERVAAIPGVERAARFFSVNMTVKGGADMVALNVGEAADVSGFVTTAGAAYDEASVDGIWLSDKYAACHDIAVGDGLTLTYKNRDITGTVVGLIKSGEYLICVPDATQLMPDYTTYGYAYVSPAMLKAVLGGEYYTQINVLSDLSKKTFAQQADAALGRTMMILSKDETVSYAEAAGESKEGKAMGSVLPVLFLAIAALTMITTMNRLTAAEKTQIGTLKALGFKDRRIGWHYTAYALMIGVIGTALGLGLGWWLGWYIMNPDGSMGTYLDMPDWTLSVPAFVWVVLAGINLLLVLVGYRSVKSLLRGPAVDTLRPYTPKKVRRLWLERFSRWDKLGFGSQWNLRDCLRHKARSAMTLFGIVGCMVLLVGSFGMQDTMNAFMKTFYHDALSYESRINVDVAADAAAIADRYDGDTCAQTTVQIDGKAVGLEIYRVRHGLVRFVAEDGTHISLADDGAYICKRVAGEFGLSVGDTVTFSPYGGSERYTVTVAGIVRSMSESVLMTEAYAQTIGCPYRVNVVYTAATDISPDEGIINVQTRQSIIDSFDTFTEIMVLMIFLLVLAAVILGIVVLYNLGVMSYTERYREMATLKVIGFKDGKIGRLLIGQNLWMTALGVVIGIPLGIGVLQYLLDALASEYEMALSLGWMTYVASTALTVGVSMVVSVMVARKNKKIDMVAALKGAE